MVVVVFIIRCLVGHRYKQQIYINWHEYSAIDFFFIYIYLHVNIYTYMICMVVVQMITIISKIFKKVRSLEFD